MTIKGRANYGTGANTCSPKCKCNLCRLERKEKKERKEKDKNNVSNNTRR